MSIWEVVREKGHKKAMERSLAQPKDPGDCPPSSPWDTSYDSSSAMVCAR
eukprot:gene42623-9224_t